LLNKERGLGFEEHVSKKYGEIRNVGPGQLRVRGSEGTFVPDFVSGAEAKAVQYLSKTKQMRIAIENVINTKQPFRIYVLETTRVSGSMRKLWDREIIEIIRVPFYG